MNILIINGSPRTNGATGQILQYIGQTLTSLDSSISIEYVNLGKMDPKLCTGCLACYKTGKCYIIDDGLDELSRQIDSCDGVIFGSPTYASNVSGHFKILIDRGHFVFEQLLRNKACFSVVTYENYGGKDALKVINSLIHLSGGAVSGKYIQRLNHGAKPLDTNNEQVLTLRCKKYLQKLSKQNPLTLSEKCIRALVFRFGLRPHAIKNKGRYKAIIEIWETMGLL